MIMELEDNKLTSLLRDTPHHGIAYQADDYELFQVLTSWKIGGTMEALVDRYQSTPDG